MKLRNKKTGEIINSEELFTNEFIIDLFSKDINYFASKVDKIIEEWQNYEEPKEHYFITEYGKVYSLNEYKGLNNVANPEDYREIGNYFETREEAEQAVEKLKAWKRLKDKGFDIESWSADIGDNYYKTGQIVLNLNNVKDREWSEYDQIMEIKSDLDICFGGEE